MGRKTQIKPFKLMNAQDISVASVTGADSTVEQTDIAMMNVSWSGGQATNGDITIEAFDGFAWHPLDFGATISLDGASGNHQLLIDVSFQKLRPVYTRTNASASGALDVSIFATSKGA